jgi:tetratricopeptide (TPR) repeat protein
MLNKLSISPWKQKLIVCIVLTAVTLAVFWQVNQHSFIKQDDEVYVTENSHLQSGFTPDVLRWAFSTTYAEFWHPLTWLSLMLDYQLYGLNPAGYHLTNLILHIFSTLLLFWLFNRMTGALWKSAFVAALFALHPLHVESVAWIAERKDVLSAFFFMLTLCFYVYYTEKPVIRRYLLVVFSFVCALMSKPMVVTLPLILILLDYWPLSRFRIGIDSHKGNLILWQLKEKAPFFILSAVFSVITLYAQYKPSAILIPLKYRLANALVSFATYLEKIFWPFDLAILYPYPSTEQIPLWPVLGSALLIFVISAAVIAAVKRFPYLLVGWLWYVITLLPVIGIIQIGVHLRHDLYTYLPSIGITFGLAWGIESLIKNKKIIRKILFPAAIVSLSIMSLFSWQQCGYWKNNTELWNHTFKVTKDNVWAHIFFSYALSKEGKAEEAIYQYNRIMFLKPDDAITYNNRGNAYSKIGRREQAIGDYNEAIRLKPDYADAYFNRGNVYYSMGHYQRAIDDYKDAIRIYPSNAEFYNNKGFVYMKLGRYQQALEDFNKAISLKHDSAYFYINRGICCVKLGQYQPAIDDFSRAISLKKDEAPAYSLRGTIYLSQGNIKPGCSDMQKACELGSCAAMESAKKKKLCE